MDPERLMYSLVNLCHTMMNAFADKGFHVVLHDRVYVHKELVIICVEQVFNYSKLV